MKISSKLNCNNVFIVYGIYWSKFKGKFQRLHFVIEDYPDTMGFSIYAEDEVNIVDPNFDHYQITKDDYGMDMFVHKAAYTSNNFLYSLINGDDDEAVEQLYKNMRHMGLDPF